MSLINDRDRAEKLAKAICSDIELYNGEALKAQAPREALKEVLKEGLQLYRSRTTEEHHSLFMQVAEERFFAKLSPQKKDELQGTLQRTSQASLPKVPSGVSLAWVVVLVALFAALWVGLGR